MVRTDNISFCVWWFRDWAVSYLVVVQGRGGETKDFVLGERGILWSYRLFSFYFFVIVSTFHFRFFVCFYLFRELCARERLVS